MGATLNMSTRKSSPYLKLIVSASKIGEISVRELTALLGLTTRTMAAHTVIPKVNNKRLLTFGDEKLGCFPTQEKITNSPITAKNHAVVDSENPPA